MQILLDYINKGITLSKVKLLGRIDDAIDRNEENEIQESLEIFYSAIEDSEKVILKRSTVVAILKESVTKAKQSSVVVS